MRHLALHPALSVAVITLALAVPRAADARVQGTPECPTPAPAPAPNTSYSCNFARMPAYSQVDPNLAFMIIPCDLYEAEGGADCTTVSCPDGWQACTNGTCTQHACGDPGVNYPYAQSWLPWGPLEGDFGADGGGISVTCSSTAEAMVLSAALAYRSPNTAIAGEFCTSSSQCPATFTCAGNTCTPAGAACNSTTFCPTGYDCNAANVCAPATCNGTNPCPSGYTCNAGSTCVPARNAAYAKNPRTSAPRHPTGTWYTYGFFQGAHPYWSWNCTNFTTVGTALTALPPGFLGGCMGGAPNLLWPGSYSAGTSVQTVFGLQQIANMGVITNLVPDSGYGWLYAGNYIWPYADSQTFQPFAAEVYNNAADGAACSTDADCSPGYCLNSRGGFNVQLPGRPSGTCASAAYQTLDDPNAGYAITTNMLRAAIDRGGVIVLGDVPFKAKLTTGSPATLTFKPTDSHYVAVDGYTVSYDANTNATLTFSYINPWGGGHQSSVFVDAANGTYSIGGQPVNVTLPGGVTNAVIYPTATAKDGSGRYLHDVTDFQNGDVAYMANVAYILYVQ